MSGPRTNYEEGVDLTAFSEAEREVAERLMKPPPRHVPSDESADRDALYRRGKFFEETA